MYRAGKTDASTNLNNTSTDPGSESALSGNGLFTITEMRIAPHPSHMPFVIYLHAGSGEASKFFRGEQIEGDWEKEVPQWDPGAKHIVGFWGQSRQKLTTSQSKELLC
jgi:hypothetical protein